MNFIPFYKFANFTIRKFQSWLGLVTLGARAIIINDKDEVLLVRHTYDPYWYIPGGGVKKGESTKAAVLRELKEEVGITVHEDPILFGIYHHLYKQVNDYPVVYIIKKFSQIETSCPEIEEAAWFDYRQPPDMISSGSMRRLTEYFTNQTHSEQW